MPASSHKLAIAVAARLAVVVPPPFTVFAEDVFVSLYADGKPAGGSPAAEIVDANDDRTIEEKIETAVRAILSGLQDDVVRELGEEWPRESGSGMAMPNARSDGRCVHLWFGDDERTPTLALPPIELAEVEGTD